MDIISRDSIMAGLPVNPEGANFMVLKTFARDEESFSKPQSQGIRQLALKLDFLQTIEPWEVYAVNILLNENFDWDTMAKEGLNVAGFKSLWEDLAERDIWYCKTNEPAQKSIETVQFVLESQICDEYAISQLSGCSIEVAILFASGMKYLDKVQETREQLARNGGGL